MPVEAEAAPWEEPTSTEGLAAIGADSLVKKEFEIMTGGSPDTGADLVPGEGGVSAEELHTSMQKSLESLAELSQMTSALAADAPQGSDAGLAPEVKPAEVVGTKEEGAASIASAQGALAALAASSYGPVNKAC